MSGRASGILLHLTSLDNAYPIGDLGSAAYAFVDFLKASRQRWWQMLAIGITDADNSPYQSLSAFAGNPLLISPEQLFKQGLLRKSDLPAVSKVNKAVVNFPAALRLKNQVLRKAFANFENKTVAAQHTAFTAFIQQEANWLEDCALFCALKNKLGTADWTSWDKALRTRQPNALLQAKLRLAPEVRYQQFIQWQFDLQWQEFKSYCKQQGVGLIGDIPQFVAHQSADVWAHPELFKLHANGKPKVVAGVPPDYFSKTGQLWGVPVYDWNMLAQQDYSWWIQRMRKNLQRFDLLRLDHFIGFVRCYEIPANAKTAQNGKYHSHVKQGTALFKVARKTFGDLPFIAEDLGNLTKPVVTLREQLQIPGTKVLQFDLEKSLDTNPPYMPVYPTLAVLYTGTHDNDTLSGWYNKLPSIQRKKLTALLHAAAENINMALINFVLKSKAQLCIFPLQDILGLGSATRMNTPQTTRGNWRWRMQKNALSNELAKTLALLTKRSANHGETI